MKTIAYFGIYNETHPRNTIFIQCLKNAGHEVLEIKCRTKGFGKYLFLYRELRKARKKIDVLFVGFPGHQAMLIAKLIYRGPIIFNGLLSLHDAVIQDRKKYARFSVRALYFWILDWIAYRLADIIVMDCDAYTDYITKEFGVSRSTFRRIFLGANEKSIFPKPVLEISKEIHYYSSFITSHGTDVIIKAMKKLQGDGVKIIFSGDGQCRARDEKMVQDLGIKNVTFISRLPSLDALNDFINSSWICLGIFSNVARADRSIASKVFEALCAGRPTVTGNTQASRELLKDGESVLFTTLGDAEDLAEKIRTVLHSEELRKKIGEGGLSAYKNNASSAIISRQLDAVIKEALSL